MAGPSNLQVVNEALRVKYERDGMLPLLSRVARAHQISVRDFASIFGISKSVAAEILSEKKMPSLELAVRVSRYFEVTVEELFGWRIDDTGERRPLLVIDQGQVRKLVGKDKTGAIELAVGKESGCGDGDGLV